MEKTMTFGIDHGALRERFCRYIAIDTRSDNERADVTPSTPGQFELARLLRDELERMGLDPYLDETNGYVYARLKGNVDGARPIGFLAHLDTAPDMRGDCTHPQIFTYDGGDISLGDDWVMSPDDFPFLNDLIGEELITTDGTTLLGADNKAGIVAIMEALCYLQAHPEILHGDLAVAFTPDEEIGHGAALLDLERFDAAYAYTMDGGPIGDFNYETFNAASACVRICGRNVHPGTAKHTMINAQLIGMELNGMLPVAERPEYTADHEGFFLLTSFEGTVEEATLRYIIRDHDRETFEAKKTLLKAIVAFLNHKYPGRVDLTLRDSYRNMLDIMVDHPQVTEIALQAMRNLDITPAVAPIRGGTDGAQLTYRGLPCPNIFVGGYNYHGRYECITTRGMALAAAVIVEIARLNAQEE